MNSAENKAALKIAVLFLLLATIWIRLSDLVVDRIAPTPEAASRLQTEKGVAFVVVTGVILFLLIRRELVRQARLERQQRRVFDGVEDVLFRVQLDGRLAALNPAFENLTRFRRADWIGRPVSEIIHPEDVPRVQSLFDVALLGKSCPPFEARLLSHGGDGPTVEITLSPELETNKVVGLLGVARDVTERRRAEEELRRQECYFRALTEDGQDIVAVIDAQGIVQYESPAMERVLGYKPAEMIGQNAFEFLHPDDAPAVMELFAEKIATPGATATTEFRHRHKDGTWRVMEVTGRALTDHPSIRGAVLHARDVTERVRLTQDKLLLLESTDEGIYGLDQNRRCTFINRAGARMLGYEPEELTGRELHELIHHHREDGSPYPIAECPIHRGDETASACRVADDVFWRKDGTSFPVEYSLQPVVEDGVTKGGVVTFQDLTTKIALENQFIQAQRVESIGKLAGGIAHDLNNILAPILMATHMFPAHARDAETAELIEIIERSGRRGSEVVKQILAFVRGTQRDKFIIQPRHLVREVARLARETFPKSILIQKSMEADPWPLEADPSQVYQVLLNLSVNARDAMPQGGKLTFELANVQVDEAEARRLGLPRPGPHVLFRVRDTGTGIPAENLDKIYEPLFSTKTQGEGTGLGLATVRSIVQHHHGACSVQTESGKGTTFSVYLPASPGALVPTVSTGPGAAPMGQGELLLVVDDEEALLTLTAMTLQKHGYRVITATNGVEAVAKFVEYRDQVRLLLTDLDMPQMGGRTLIQTVRGLAPHLRVLIISGGTGASSLRDEIGNAEHLAKPFNSLDLLTTTRQLLDAGGTTFLAAPPPEAERTD